MDAFRDKAFYQLLWYAIVTCLIAAIVALTNLSELHGALTLFAGMALVFSLICVCLADWLTDERITLIEPWRSLRPEDRPAGAGGKRWAHHCLEEYLVRFGAGALGVAIALMGIALLLPVDE
jgi:hypothetical protein